MDILSSENTRIDKLSINKINAANAIRTYLTEHAPTWVEEFEPNFTQSEEEKRESFARGVYSSENGLSFKMARSRKNPATTTYEYCTAEATATKVVDGFIKSFSVSIRIS